MLVLTRKQGEKIRIGEDVVITVVRTKGKAVRLGIQAPAHVSVLRGEIAASIAAESQRSAHAGEEEPDGESGAGSPGALVLCAASCASVGSLSSDGRGPLAAMMAGR